MNIKNNFPFFKNNDMTYLDSAATSQTPEVVINGMTEHYEKMRSNVHRGLYSQSEEVSRQYEEVRIKTARFIGANRDEVIFTPGATHASNMLVYSLEHTMDFKQGDEIIVSVMEHHASLLPLQELARRKEMVIKTIPLTDNFKLDMSALDSLVTEKTKIVSVALTSNVLGTINDIKKISEIVHQKNILMVTDATAAVGHMEVGVKDLGVDFLYFSGHKMCGPTGVGILYGKKELLSKMQPGIVGGGIVDEVTDTSVAYVDSPSRFEAGTPPIAEVIGFGVAIEYLNDLKIEEIEKHVQELVGYAVKKMQSIEGVTVLAEQNPKENVGIISFDVSGVHPHDVAEILGKENIAVRAGHHCAMPLITALGVPATTRMSLYLYNTKEDVDRLIVGIEKVKEVFK